MTHHVNPCTPRAGLAPRGPSHTVGQMDIDVTYLIQMGLFLFALVSLNAIFIKPIQKVIEERQKKSEGAEEEVERLNRRGNADMEAYQHRMREARARAQRERDVVRERGRDEEREILAKVRAEIADTLNDARQQVQAAEASARAELSQESQEMARALVEKVLGREVTA